MYLVGLFILLFQLIRTQKLSKDQFIYLFVFLNILSEIAIFFFPVIRGGLFALIILASVVVELLLKKGSEYKITQDMIIEANLIFLFVYAVWILDKTHILCNPLSLFQGHAVWHVISAYAGWLMFKAMDSEYEKFDLNITIKGRIKL